jgi:hypothetical protein
VVQLNPRHRGAHEYVGEAYRMVNDLAKAEEHLAALQNICLLPCEDYEDLRSSRIWGWLAQGRAPVPSA